MPKTPTSLVEIDASAPVQVDGHIPITDVVRERFEKKYRKNDDGCWIWQAHCDPDHYGQFKFQGVAERAHRFSYMLYVGPIEPGMDIDHTCHVRRCVNPKHLEVVTHTENMRRMREANVSEDKDGSNPYNWDITTPGIVLKWAEDVAKRSQLKREIVIQGRGCYPHMRDPANTAWRDCHEEDGYAPQDPMSWIALFLATVRFGVNWKDAARAILQVTPFAIRNWKEANPDFRNDLTLAIAEGRKTRYVELEDRTIDALERKMPAAPFKEIVRLAEVMRRREEMHMKPRPGNEGGTSGGGAGPTFNLIINTTADNAPALLDRALGVMDGEFSVLPDAPPELPPADDPDLDDEDEDDDF